MWASPLLAGDHQPWCFSANATRRPARKKKGGPFKEWNGPPWIHLVPASEGR
jgi:hypothetical protein